VTIVRLYKEEIILERMAYQKDKGKTKDQTGLREVLKVGEGKRAQNAYHSCDIETGLKDYAIGVKSPVVGS